MNRVLALLALAATSLPAQDLVRDIRPGQLTSVTSNPQRLCTAGAWTYFVANDVDHGYELWRTDGTAAGTQLFLDQTPGTASTAQRLLTAFAGGLAFATPEGLCWSNGTPGHVVVLGPMPLDDQTVGRPFVVGTHLFYVAAFSSVGLELHVSDGTPAGTGLLADINPGVASSMPHSFCALGGVLYFSARNAAFQNRLYRSDGTPGGTFEVAPAAGYTSCNEVAVAGNRVFFANQFTGELWQSNGTAAGTTLVRGGYTYGPAGLFGGGSKLAFIAGDAATGAEPWTSDGTPAGTQLLADTQPGPTGGMNGFLTAVGARVLFNANDGVHGFEPWITDLTPAGTQLLRDVNPGPGWSGAAYATAGGGGAFFAGDDGGGYELWFTDGTPAGTHLVQDLRPAGGAEPGAFTPLGALTVFTADDGVHGREPWVTDGTAAGTQLLRDIAAVPQHGNPRFFQTLGKRTLFFADDGVHGEELWVTDGTTAGTQLLLDTVPGPARGAFAALGIWQGKLWFTIHGHDLWRTDGTIAGTALLVDLAPALPNVLWFVGLDDRAVLGGEFQLYVTDGTIAGTVPLQIQSQTQMLGGVRFGDHVYFQLGDTAHGRELWRTDGTTAGTSLFFDFVPGPDSSSVGALAVGDRLYLSAASQVTGPFHQPADFEPWVSDGTVAGTVRLADLAPGIGSSFPGGFRQFAGKVWFTAFDPSGISLYTTDGTPAGTTLFQTLIGGPYDLVVAGSRLFFQNDGEVWSTDGTLAGTVPALDIAPGPASSEPRNFVALGASTAIAFTAIEPGHPRELWRSDGTAAGTVRVASLVLDSVTTALHRTGTDVFFSADDGVLGRELYALRLRSLSATMADVLGSGCRGALGTPQIRADAGPRLGNPFAIHLDGAPPLAGAFAVHSPALVPGGALARCSVALDLGPAVTLFALTDGAGHAAANLFVPNAPFILGLEFYTQWAVVDPTGGYLGTFSLSPVLDWLIGS